MFNLTDIGSNVMEALSSMNLWIAIAKSVFIILVGFIFTKTKTLPETTGKTLTKIVMNICLPCLAFGSFMNNTMTSAQSVMSSSPSSDSGGGGSSGGGSSGGGSGGGGGGSW